MKIGIGVTTYKREEIFQHTFEELKKANADVLYVARDTDKDRRGIAARKNECLRVMQAQECDYMFLFDDDCYPLYPHDTAYWMEHFIRGHKMTGEHHFAYTSSKYIKNPERYYHNGIEILSFNGSGGCCLFYTKKAIDTVGAFNEEYGLYGFEHIEHSMRIKMAGLTTFFFPSLGRTEKYIYSRDYEEEGFFKNNSTVDQQKKEEAHKKNLLILRRNPTIYIPL